MFGELPEPVRKAAVGITLVGTAAVFAIPLITATAGALVKVAAAIGTLKLGAAAAGVKKLTLAFVGLKTAALAIPWAAIAALIGATAIALKQSADRAQELTDKLGSDKLADVESGIAQLRDRQSELNKQLETLQNSDYYRGLQSDINELKREIATVDEQIDAATRRRQLIIDVQLINDEIPKIKGFDTLSDAGIQEALTLAGVNKPKIDLGGVGRGSTAVAAPKPQDDTKQAEEQLRSLVQANNLLLTRSQIEKDILSTQFELEDTLERISELQGISPQLRQQLETQANVLAVNKENTIALDAATAAAADIFQSATDTLTPLNQQKRLLEAQLNGNVQRVQDEIEIEEAIRGKSKAEADYIRQKLLGIQALRQEVEATKELDDLYQGIGDTIENGIISAIDAGINSLVDGTKSLDKALQEIASGVLKDIGNQLIRFGVNAALSGLGGGDGIGVFSKLFGGGRAEGGSVSPDKTFLVGEKGPELFTPTTNGTIIPNDFFNSARDALRSPDSGSVAADNPEAFAAAAAAIERNTTNINNRQSTVSQETSFNNFAETLGSQQRETIRFETVRVGEMDMVTKDEALKIGAESAKAAEASVFNALKNKPSVRKSIGMS